LSTWAKENEENPLHGLLPLSDRYILGGDIRSVCLQQRVEGQKEFKKYWLMNADLEAAMHLDKFWVSATAGMEPKGPRTEAQGFKSKVRGYFVRADLLDDHLSLRTGLFTPKFGLMLSDHTAFIRRASKLPADPEQTQFEATFLTDRWEATLALMVKSNMFDREGKSKSGVNFGVSRFIKKNRLNLNVMKTKLSLDTSETDTLVLGTSGVLTFSKRFFGMYELSKIQNTLTSSGVNEKTNELANYFSLNCEVKRGVIPFVRYEYWDSNLSTKNTSTGRWGGGLSWYPRPHFQFEGKYLRSIINSSGLSNNEVSGIFHYYF